MTTVPLCTSGFTQESRHIVTPAIEQNLRGLIEIVKQAAPPRAPAFVTASEESLQSAAKSFEAWLRDWRTTASAGMFRRDYRIMLGISRRRNVETPDPTPEPAPQPPDARVIRYTLAAKS